MVKIEEKRRSRSIHKNMSFVFHCEKVFRRFSDTWSFVNVTDCMCGCVFLCIFLCLSLSLLLNSLAVLKMFYFLNYSQYLELFKLKDPVVIFWHFIPSVIPLLLWRHLFHPSSYLGYLSRVLGIILPFFNRKSLRSPCFISSPPFLVEKSLCPPDRSTSWAIQP